MGKPQKPFIAARIPIGLEEALEKHTKSTGESKTTALINALGNYLGWSQDGETKPSVSNRLNLLEERVEELEKLIQTPQQTSLLELAPATNYNKNTKEYPTVTKNNNAEKARMIEQKLFNHKEVAEITGIPYNTIRKNLKTDKIVEGNNKKFKLTRNGKTSKWAEIT